MTVFNLGSINVDHVYRVTRLPVAGETIDALSLDAMLGGKGANQSVAVARAGGAAVHIGMVGDDTQPRLWLAEFGVDAAHVGTVEGATGHANVFVDEKAENLIVVWPGANRKQSLTQIELALHDAGPDDILLLQNETNHILEAAKLAKERGLFVIYSAAPFDPHAAAEMLPLIDLLVVNSVEAQQMAEHMGVAEVDLPVPNMIVTRGAEGADWRGETTLHQDAFPVEAIDTTGAGDCFLGTVAAALDAGADRAEALRRAAAASAIQVTRHGAAQANPTSEEVSRLLRGM